MKKYLILSLAFLSLCFLYVPSKANAFIMSSCSGASNALQIDSVLGFICGNPMGAATHIGETSGISVNPGTVALGTKSVTVTGITGMLAGDVCMASLAATQGLTAGLILAGCQATADGTASITFATPIAIGISVGSIIIDVAWIG